MGCCNYRTASVLSCAIAHCATLNYVMQDCRFEENIAQPTRRLRMWMMSKQGKRAYKRLWIRIETARVASPRKPWREPGESVTCCGKRTEDYALHGQDSSWADQAGACRPRCRAPRLEMASAFDSLPEAANAVAEAHGVRQASSADAVFEPGEIDTVLIASMTSTHAYYIKQAIAALIIANNGTNTVCMRRAELRKLTGS